MGVKVTRRIASKLDTFTKVEEYKSASFWKIEDGVVHVYQHIPGDGPLANDFDRRIASIRDWTTVEFYEPPAPVDEGKIKFNTNDNTQSRTFEFNNQWKTVDEIVEGLTKIFEKR